MNVTRKQFISSAGAGLAAAVALPVSGLSTAAAAAAAEIGIDAARFRSIVGMDFDFAVGIQTAALTLQRVEVRASNPKRMSIMSTLKCETVPASEQFSLFFDAAMPAPLAEGTYNVRNLDLGYLQMFVVPTGTTTTGRATYRADFGNLLG